MKEMIDFLRSQIMGRALYTSSLTYTLDDGALEGTYSDQMTFSNLVWSGSYMKFDLTVVAKDELFDVKSGKQVKDYNAASLFRYEVAKRSATGQITGFMRFVSSSMDAPPAQALASSVYGLRLEGGELKWSECEIPFRDQPGSDGVIRPVVFEAECRLFAENRKARYEYDGRCLDFNPQTLERTPSANVYPKFLARET